MVRLSIQPYHQSLCHCHPTIINRYAFTSRPNPLAPKQRDLQWSIVGFPYLVDGTLIRASNPIVSQGISMNNIVMVHALSILGSSIKCTPSDLISLKCRDRAIWSPRQEG